MFKKYIFCFIEHRAIKTLRFPPPPHLCLPHYALLAFIEVKKNYNQLMSVLNSLEAKAIPVARSVCGAEAPTKPLLIYIYTSN